MTYYYWDFDTDNVFLEEDENGDTIAEYTHEPGLYGELIAQERDGQVRYYNFDGQGSTRELTDENGDITDTYTYTAFGEEIAHTGTTENPFRYKGAWGYYTNSDTNDIYVRERIYEPTNGRWLSEDPLGQIDTPNQFWYVRNSPLSWMDPSGLIPTNVPSKLLVTNVNASPLCDCPEVWWGLWVSLNAAARKAIRKKGGILIRVTLSKGESQFCDGRKTTDFSGCEAQCISLWPGQSTAEYVPVVSLLGTQGERGWISVDTTIALFTLDYPGSPKLGSACASLGFKPTKEPGKTGDYLDCSKPSPAVPVPELLIREVANARASLKYKYDDCECRCRHALSYEPRYPDGPNRGDHEDMRQTSNCP